MKPRQAWRMPKRKRRGNPRKSRKAETLALFDDLISLSGLSHGVQSHIEELSYERLKDPGYQEWMTHWLDQFFTMFLRDLRAERGRLAAKRKTRALRTAI